MAALDEPSHRGPMRPSTGAAAIAALFVYALVQAVVADAALEPLPMEAQEVLAVSNLFAIGVGFLVIIRMIDFQIEAPYRVMSAVGAAWGATILWNAQTGVYSTATGAKLGTWVGVGLILFGGLDAIPSRFQAAAGERLRPHLKRLEGILGAEG